MTLLSVNDLLAQLVHVLLIAPQADPGSYKKNMEALYCWSRFADSIPELNWLFNI